jgi:hypothetical protein
MACHGVISAGFGRNRFCIKLEITPPSISNHSRYGTPLTYIGGLTVGFFAGAALYMTMRAIAARRKQ